MRTILLLIFAVFLPYLNYGQTPNALRFDGADDFLTTSVPHPGLNSISTGDFTFEVWIKGDLADNEFSSQPTIFSNRSGIGIGCEFFIHPPWLPLSTVHTLAVQLNGYNYFVMNNGTFNASIFDNSCHHLAITRMGGLLIFYIDGLEIGTRVVVNPEDATTTDNAHALWIGNDLPSNGRFNGVISDVRIWNFSRTQTEINDDMHTFLTGTEPGLVGLWLLNDGAGQVANDLSSFNENVQLGNTPNADATDPTWVRDDCAGTYSSSLTDNIMVEIQIMPNPSNGLFSVHGLPENSSITIINVLGEEILRQDTGNSTITFDLSDQPNGIYLVHIQYGSSVITKKLIRQ